MPPASGGHRASGDGLVTDCVDGVSLQLPCRGGLPRPPVLAGDALSDGHSAVLFSVNVTTGRRGSLPLQDLVRNLEACSTTNPLRRGGPPCPPAQGN